MRKTFWFATLLLLSVATLAPAAGPEKVRVKLDRAIRGEHAIFFVAREKGYLESERIEMSIEEGGGSFNTLLVVSQQKFELGVADLPALIYARTRRVSVIGLATVGQKSAMALVALKGAGLKTPKDLEGKTVGVDRGEASFVFYGTLLAANRVEQVKISEVAIQTPYESRLLAKKVQVVPAEIGAEIADLQAAAGADGLEILNGADWGYDVLGAGLFTSVRLARGNPGLVRRFTRAYLRAFRDVVGDPRGAVAILVKQNPGLAPRSDALLRQLQANVRSTFTSDDTRTHGLGWNSPARWRHTHDVLLRAGMIGKGIEPLTSLYTNDFIVAPPSSEEKSSR